MNDKIPCKDCPDRYSGCHAKCERYREFRRELDERNKRIREQKFKEKLTRRSYKNDFNY